MHLPRAEREPSELSPGRMLLHIHKTEGVREGERDRGMQGERERERGAREFFLVLTKKNPSYPKND